MHTNIGRIKRRLLLSIVVLFVFALTACSLQPGTVTLEQYDKLKLGMKYDAVVGILGKPHQIQPFMGIKQCTWVNGERHIHVKFIADRAVYYSSKGLREPARKAE